MAGEEGRLKAAPVPGFPLHGDFYVRLIRSLHAMLGQDPQQLQIPALKLGEEISYQATILDATGAPFRRNGKEFDVALNFGAIAASIAELQLINPIPASTGQSPNPQIPFRVLVIDAVEFGGATAGAIGIIPGEDTTFPLAAPFPVLLEDIPTDTSRPRGIETRIRVRVGTAALATAGSAIVRQLPNVGATGVFQKNYSGLCVFPGEELLIFSTAVNVACYIGVTGRIFEFGVQQPSV